MRAIAWEETRWRTLFFTVWIGQTFSLLGSRLVQFALVWWLTAATESGTVLAAATMAALLPQIVLGPFVGALIDRWNRRWVMVVADSLIALSIVLLALLFAYERIAVWHIYVIMLIRSIGGAFHWGAMQASTTLMVPAKHYSRVAGLNQALQGAANIVAPAMGAVLIALLPMQWVLSIDVLTAAIAVLPLLFIAIPQPSAGTVPSGTPRLSVWAGVREGFRFMIGWRGMLYLIGIAAALNLLFAPAGALLPLLVVTRFGGEAYHYAGLQMALGLGVIAGGLALGVWGGFRRRIVTSLAGIVGLGSAALLLGLTPSALYPLAIVAVLFVGIMQPIANGPLLAVMQATVPPEMQGRVFSLLGSASAAMMPIGLWIAGPLSDRFGAQIWYIAGGVAAIVLGLGALLVRPILTLEQHATSLQTADGGRTTEAERDCTQSTLGKGLSAQPETD